MNRSLRTRTALAALATGVAAVGVGTAAVPAAAAPVDLIDWEGSTWQVADDNVDRLATFAAPAFDDSSWKTVTVQPGKVMGYGDSDSQSPELSYGPNGNAKYVVTYFRTEFEVPDLAALSDLTLNYLRDDGVVIYVNGVEVTRDNLPAGALTTSTYAPNNTDGSDERAIHTTAVPTTALVQGTNVLAVQLHNRSAGSSDLALKLELTAEQDDVEVPATSATPVVAGLAGLAAVGAVIVFRRKATEA